MRLRQVLNAAYRATRTGTASPAHPSRPALTDIPGFPGVNRQRVCAARTRSTRLVAMPAASTTLRMLAVSVIASLTVTGCQTFEDAGVAMGRSELVNDLAARLDRALELTYSADYQLPGGQTRRDRAGAGPGAIHVHLSGRATHRHPGGHHPVHDDRRPPAVHADRPAHPGQQAHCDAVRRGQPAGPRHAAGGGRAAHRRRARPTGGHQAERHHGRRAPRRLRRGAAVRRPATSPPA